MVRYFFHVALQQIYILLQFTPELEWHTTYPDGTPTRFRSVHMYARQAPDQGYPESECGLVPVQQEMFIAFMKEVSFQEAMEADPRLVQYTQRIAAYPLLPQALSQLPRWSKLFLVECGFNASEHLFDLYRIQGPAEQMVYLTPLLAQMQMFECKDYGGLPRVVVPRLGTFQEAASLLALALDIKLWGSREHAPAYAYEVEHF